MKKKLLALVLVLCCIANLTACAFVEDLYWELADRYEDYDDYDDYDDDDYGYEDAPVPEHVHSFTERSGSNPTCVAGGKAPEKVCACGYVEGGEALPALGHDWVTKPEQPATPVSVGYTAYNYCTRCGLTEGKQEVQFVCVNHKFTTQPEKLATPSQKGHTAYQKCSICGLEQGKKETVFTCPVVDLLPSVYDRLSAFKLTETDKKEILGMYDAVMTFQKSYTFKSYVTVEQLDQYFRILAYSLPETMMIYGSYRYYHSGDKVTSVVLPYVQTQQEYINKMTAVEQEVKPLLAAVQGKSDFEKIKYFHDYLVNNCTYTLEADDVVNVYGTLVNGINHCDGFSDTMNLLCNAAGVKCATVLGYYPEYHAWNLLQLDGRYYYVDLVADNVDWYGKPLYAVFFASRAYIESIHYVLEDYYTDIVPDAPQDLNIKNRYLPTITAGQNVNTELTNIANEIIKNKPAHIYIRCDGDSVFNTAKENVHAYITKAIQKAYPNAKVDVMNKGTRKLVCIVVTY